MMLSVPLMLVILVSTRVSLSAAELLLFLFLLVLLLGHLFRVDGKTSSVFLGLSFGWKFGKL